MYNFKDVWRYFQRRGWTSRNGHELSYDHYYVKPNKDLVTGEENVDYFLGERALIAYAYDLKIFGDVEDEPLAVASPSQLKETFKAFRQRQSVASSQRSRKRGRQQGSEHHREVSSGEESIGSSRSRRSVKSTASNKKPRNKKGSHADDPITFSSDGSGSEDASDEEKSSAKRTTESSSDGEESSEWSGADGRGGFEEPEDEEEEDSASVEVSSEEDDGSSDNDDDDGEEDSEEGEHVPKGVVAGKSNGVSHSTGKAKSTHHKHKHKRLSSRPRLKTSSGKKPQQSRHGSSAMSSSHSKRSSSSASRSEAGQKCKSSPLREEGSKKPSKHHKHTEHSEPSQSHFDDENFTLGGDLYGASPPRRPPTNSRGSQGRRSVPTTPMSSFVGSDDDSSGGTERTRTPSTQHKSFVPVAATNRPPSRTSQTPRPLSPPVETWSEEHSFLSPSFDTSFDVDVTESADIPDTQDTVAGSTANNARDPSPTRAHSTPSPSTSTEAEAPVRSITGPSSFTPDTLGPSELRTTLLEMKGVQFPLDPAYDKFHVLVATRLDDATCIRIKHEQSHTQRQCVFRDVKDIRENKGNNPYEVPSSAVIEALLRCLRALPGKIINPGRLTESKEGPGKIELLRVEPQSVSELGSGEASSLRCMTLRFAFPCFEFWQCHHNFPMSLVPATESRVADLLSELKESEARLHEVEEKLELVRRDREGYKQRVDDLKCERDSLQQQLAEAKNSSSEANETSSPHAELVAKYKAKLVQSRAEVVKLKAELSQLKQVCEREVVNIKPEPNNLTRRKKSAGQSDKELEAQLSVVLSSPWLDALKPHVAEAVSTSATGFALEWKAVVAIKGEYYQAQLNSSEGTIGPVVVLKTGTYQVNAHVTHERSMRIALRVASPKAGTSSSTFVDATLVQLYENKRRISRIDRVVTLHEHDRVEVVLQAVESSDGSSSVPETWPAIFKPRDNQIVLTLLDPHVVYELPPRDAS